MWPDNETDVDFLNFGSVADTIAEIIVQADGRPISVGVSGAWGVGKSSLIKLTEVALDGRQPDDKDKDRYVFVNFNAWLYQGYDDARAALMEVIATRLEELAEERQTGLDKTREFLRNVNWMRAAKLTIGSAVALAMGLPPVGLVGEAAQLGRRVLKDGVDANAIQGAEDLADKGAGEAQALWNPTTAPSPPKQIQALRDSFEAALSELDVTLVVLIDDLDRCLPETTISTLEAIRLFLFLENTAFVIAADDAMIKHAVRRHFEDPDDETLITNYFDKLIQVPIRVPTLGTQDVRAYMILLFVENSDMTADDKMAVQEAVALQLKHTWEGKRVDRAFIQSLPVQLPTKLAAQLDSADRLAPLMTTASGIVGNPRLVKRFLNALSIRMTISNAQGVGVDEAVLAKLLLFERLGAPAAYTQLASAINGSDDGAATFLDEWETAADKGEDVDLPEAWDTPFIREWLTLPPQLASIDLRGALYVSREHAPIITPEDRLSSDAAELLTALLSQPDMARELEGELAKLSKPELAAILDRLLSRAVQEQEWGVPPILEACLVVASADPALGARLAGFLSERPPSQVRANIVARIREHEWSKPIFEKWLTQDVELPVKAAIAPPKEPKRGNVTK